MTQAESYATPDLAEALKAIQEKAQMSGDAFVVAILAQSAVYFAPMSLAAKSERP